MRASPLGLAFVVLSLLTKGVSYEKALYNLYFRHIDSGKQPKLRGYLLYVKDGNYMLY